MFDELDRVIEEIREYITELRELDLALGLSDILDQLEQVLEVIKPALVPEFAAIRSQERLSADLMLRKWQDAQIPERLAKQELTAEMADRLYEPVLEITDILEDLVREANNPT